MTYEIKQLKKFVKPFVWLMRSLRTYWHRGWWQKIVTVGTSIVVVILIGMYGIARWYQYEQRTKPLYFGVTFIADYAQYLGVDPHTTFNAILNDLHPHEVRLVSYWSDIEPNQGQYDFSELDWEMQQAKTHDTKVTLAIGLRQPRWPECHAPSWIDTTKAEVTWQPQLEQYMTTIINRYKHSSVLVSYQLENEYYNHFGSCNNFDRSRLKAELSLVKKLDPNHTVIMSRSNNYAGLSLSQPLPDTVGISVYRHVWNTVGIKTYFTYPFPSWYYAFLAGAEQLATGKPSVIHELQTEPWPPNGQDILHTSLSEQNKTFNAATLKSTTKFAKQTGIKNIDLWGAEYWYYRMVTLKDPSVWHTAEQLYSQS